MAPLWRVGQGLGLLVGAAVASSPPVPGLPTFSGSYGSTLAEHERFGREVGAAFALAARKRLSRSRNSALTKWVTQDEDGLRTLRAFADAHERAYPLYMAELRGIAQGVGVPFAHILALNLHQELAYFVPPNRTAVPLAPEASHCSDYSLWPWVAHNEDSGVEEAGTLFLARVAIDGASFTAAAYAGDLPSGAFGFNSHGVGFSLNMVDPTHAQLAGAGRGFVSRRLLGARTMAEAVAIATADGQCAGHSYQLISLLPGGGGLLAQAEAVSGGRHALRVLSPGSAPLFHSNHLRFIQPPVAQRISTSSSRRLARAQALPLPTSAADLLRVLGDGADRAYPVFHDDASRAAGDISRETTLASALFDVRNGTLSVFAGNPASPGSVRAVLTIPRPEKQAAPASILSILSDSATGTAATSPTGSVMSRAVAR